MPKPARKITCSEADRNRLEQLAFSRTEAKPTVERAQMVLGCLENKEINEIAQAFRTRPNTVIKWRDRFAKMGLAGLDDAPRPGAKRVYDEAFRKRVLALVATPPPAGFAAWDGPTVAAVLNCSTHAVWRVLRRQGVSLQRQRVWCIGTEPQLAAKAVEIVGLYLDPPRNVLVLSVEENGGRQLQERTAGGVLTDNGKIARRLKSAGERHGKLDLCDALRIGTGQLPVSFSEPKRWQELLAFLERIKTESPADQELHCLMDDCRGARKDEAWWDPGCVTFHFMPSTASWLAQVEIWLGILSCHPPGGAWNVGELKQAMMDYLRAYGPQSKPFRWVKCGPDTGCPD